MEISNEMGALEATGVYTLNCRNYYFSRFNHSQDITGERIMRECGIQVLPTWHALNLYNAIHLGTRAQIIQASVENFVHRNPNSQIVNLGCSFDTLFSRTDLAPCRQVNVDLPSVIHLREKLRMDPPGVLNVEADLSDISNWLKFVEKQRPTLFIMAGVAAYLSEQLNREIIGAVSQQIAQGELLIDGCSPLGRTFTNISIQLSGETEAPFASAQKESFFQSFSGPKLSLRQHWNLSSWENFRIHLSEINFSQRIWLRLLSAIGSSIKLGTLWHFSWRVEDQIIGSVGTEREFPAS